MFATRHFDRPGLSLCMPVIGLRSCWHELVLRAWRLQELKSCRTETRMGSVNWLCALTPEFDPGDWIALIAAVAALAATWQAYRSAQASRKSHLLAVKADQRYDPKIEVNLVGARQICPADRAERIYVCELLISNLSIVANSIKRISLSMEHRGRDGPPSQLSVPHRPGVPDEAGASDPALALPASIGAGETLSIVARFLVAEELIRGVAVESYSVVVTDSHDRDVEQRAILIWGSEA